MANRGNSELSYNLTVAALYGTAIGLNLWLVCVILQQSEEGQELLARIKEATLGRFKDFKNQLLHDFSSSLVILEAEELVREAWQNEE